MGLWDLLRHYVSAEWLYVIGMIVQAAGTGWFLRGLKADKDRVIEDATALRKDFKSFVEETKRCFEELREKQIETDTAYQLQAGEILAVKEDFVVVAKLVNETMPRVIEGAIERAERRGEERLRGLFRRRRGRR